MHAADFGARRQFGHSTREQGAQPLPFALTDEGTGLLATLTAGGVRSDLRARRWRHLEQRSSRRIVPGAAGHAPHLELRPKTRWHQCATRYPRTFPAFRHPRVDVAELFGDHLGCHAAHGER
jgi:hypothetical protein